MTSTELNLGLPEARRPSSRVLKPPGGGHTNIFAEPEVVAARPRPKHDQQNSSNLNCVMNTPDPIVTAKKAQETTTVNESAAVTGEIKSKSDNTPKESPNNANNSQGGRVRVPPGGFSSGLW